jgi:hypothetical protein
LATGGELASVVAAIRGKEARIEELKREIDKLGRPVRRFADPSTLRASIEERVRDWRSLLRKHVERGSSFSGD